MCRKLLNISCVCVIFYVILMGLVGDCFLSLSLPTLKSGDPVSRLGFYNLCPGDSLPNTLHAFPGVCFFHSCIVPCSFVSVCLFSRSSQAIHSIFYSTQVLFHCVPLMLLMETLMEEEIVY